MQDTLPLESGDTRPRLTRYLRERQAALERPIYVALLRPAVFGCTLSAFVLDEGRLCVLPRGYGGVPWQGLPCRLADRSPFNHSEAIFLIDFNSSKRYC